MFLVSTVMLQQRLKFGVISENALVRDCATAEDQQRAFQVFAEMLQQRLKPYVISSNSLVSACEISEDQQHALHVFAGPPLPTQCETTSLEDSPEDLRSGLGVAPGVPVASTGKHLFTHGNRKT